MIPRLNASLIDRPSLMEALDASSGLTVVSAPSGFGKTVLLAQWARELALRGETVRWRRDGDLPDLDGIVILDGLSIGGVEGVVDRLTSLSEETTNLRVILSTRDRVPPSLEGYQVLTEADLAFTDAEVENLASGVGVDAAAAKLALEGMEAWPLGVVSALKPHEMGEFARGVYNSVSQGTPRKMLTMLAGVSKVRPGLMAETLGVPDVQVREAQETLLELGYATKGIDCTGEFLSLRPALRDCLWELGGADRSDCAPLRRAQALAEVGCAPANSMAELMDLGELDEAQKVASEHFSAVLRDRRRSLQSLRSVPLERLEKYPSLVLCRLVLARPDGTIPISTVEATARGLHMSLARERARLDAASYARLLAMQIAAERMLGMWGSARTLSYELLRLTQRPEWLEAVRHRKEAPIVLAVTSLVGILVVDPELAAESADQGTKLASAQGNALEQTHALSLGALNLALQGDVYGSAVKLDQVAEVSAGVELDPPEFSWVDGALAEVMVAYFRGDVVTAQRRLDELTPLMERMEQWPVVVYAESFVARMQDGSAEALGLTEHRLENRPEGLAVSRPWWEMLKCRRADLATWSGRYEEAQQILDGVGEEAGPEVGRHRSVLSRARLALYLGEYAKALEHLSSLDDAEVTPMIQRELLLVLALTHFKLGELGHSRDSLDAALNAGQEGTVVEAVAGVPHALVLEVARAFDLEELEQVAMALPESLRTEQHRQLSKTEVEVLVALAREKTMAYTAQDIFISVNTLKSHSRSIYKKLGVGSREEALAAARRRGLI